MPNKAGQFPKPLVRAVTPALVRSALAAITPDVDRETWVRIAMAIKSELAEDGFDPWDEWSQKSSSYSPAGARDTWRSVKAGGRVGIGTLFKIAQSHGFALSTIDGVQTSAQTAEMRIQAQAAAQEKARQRAIEAADYSARADAAAKNARNLWDGASDTGVSGYLTRKGVGAHGVRFARDGTLLIPLRNGAGELQNLQRIAHAPPANGRPEKSFLPGGRKSELWHMIGDALNPTTLLVAEGYATAATLHEASKLPVAVAFDAGNLVHVAGKLRDAFPAALIVVCGDDDRDTEKRTGKNPGRSKAAAAARAASRSGAPTAMLLPQGLPPGGTDFNDLSQHAGLEAVGLQVRAALAAPQLPKVQRGQKLGDAAPIVTPTDADPPTESASSQVDDFSPAAVAASSTESRAPGQSDPFYVDESGVWFVARDAQGEQRKPMWICSRLVVAARTRADDGNGWGVLLQFRDPDGQDKTWAMPAAMLSGEGSEWAGRLRDMGLTMYPGTKARNLIAQYIDTREVDARVTCVDRVGWHGIVYVLPSSSITATDASDEARRYVFQSDSGMEDTFRRHGALQEWQARVSQLAVGNTRLVFAISVALAGPLLRPAGMESGGFHFRGDSSQGKTTALRVAASVWGRPNYMQRWRTTDNALEATAVQHCDCTLILDEFGQLDPKVAGECAYMLANGQEKGRATRGGQTRKRRTWGLLFLSSGEVSLAGHMAEAGKRTRAGMEVRMVDVPLDAGAGMGGVEVLHGYEGPAALADAIVGAAGRQYGTAGRAWLEWIVNHMSQLTAELESMIDEQRASLVPEAASEQVRRVGMRFALVGVAGELASKAGITGWMEGEASAAARRCFNAWLAARGHMENGEDAQMLGQVRAFLEKNGDSLFTHIHRAHDDHRPNTPLRCGVKRLVNAEGDPIKFDTAMEYLEKANKGPTREHEEALTEYLVFPEAFNREICKGFDPRAVAALLKKRGHLRHDKDRLMMKQRVPGMGKIPVYLVKPSIFSDDV